jgi:L-histidine N-alpha-methyltransferase
VNDAILLPRSSGRPRSCGGFLSEAVAGLSRRQKMLPCKFLYDEDGATLFNEICELEEYYPTRTEDQILRDNINEIAV